MHYIYELVFLKPASRIGEVGSAPRCLADSSLKVTHCGGAVAAGCIAQIPSGGGVTHLLVCNYEQEGI